MTEGALTQHVLVVAPHGLDEVLGCGGVMARHADAGDEVHVLVLFGGRDGRDAFRRRNAEAAAAILGAHPPSFAGFPENRGDGVPLLNIVTAIERHVQTLAPRTVYVSHGGNLNVDHYVAFRACVTAVRPAPGSSVRNLFSYEVLSSTDWAPKGIGSEFRPTRHVDIGTQLIRKVAALKAYGDEMRPHPHARSVESAQALALLRGTSVGFSAAEAFEVVRELV